MSKIFKNKKTMWVIIMLIVVMIVGGVSLNIYLNTNKDSDISKMEYKTDIEPFIKRFGETISIDTCFWKSDVFSNRGIGPSSYWMKGFIVINKTNLEELQTQYSLQSANPSFEKGIEPNITGFNEFVWHYNKELSRKITGTSFIGEIYLDTLNGVIYFDLESN